MTSARAKSAANSRDVPPARASAEANSMPDPPARANPRPTPITAPPARADLTSIRYLGRLLDDLERLRIMNANRIDAGERELGDALPHLHAILDPLRAAEHQADLELVRAWRKHPLAPWAKQLPGIGEKSIARLIAVTGDPGERANPAKLWAYCGHGDPLRSGPIRKGATQDDLFKRGNPEAKKRVYLIAEACMKAKGTSGTTRSPYRDVYDDRRAATEGRLHERACIRCGPSGHPAQPSSPWSDGHKHADALRIVGKAFLLDLWLAARATQSSPDTQSSDGGAGS